MYFGNYGKGVNKQLYFIQFGNDGPIRIGETYSSERKLHDLQAGSPEKLRLLKTVTVPKPISEKVQSKFKECQIRPDWFAPSKPLLSWIQSLDEQKVQQEFGLPSKPRRRRILNAATLTKRQKQVVMGTILGGSSLIRSGGGHSYYLSMRGKETEWLLFKAGELDSIATDRSLHGDGSYRWHSLCHPSFDELHGLFYEGNERQLSMEAMNGLHDIAFAVWFGDCGRIVKDQVVLYTHIWGEHGTHVIADYFESLGWSGEIFMERLWLRYRLNPASSIEFMSLATPHLPAWFSVPANFKMELD